MGDLMIHCSGLFGDKVMSLIQSLIRGHLFKALLTLEARLFNILPQSASAALIMPKPPLVKVRVAQGQVAIVSHFKEVYNYSCDALG